MRSTTLLTLERGLEVLETVSASDGQATAKVLSRRLGLKIGTCYHLLRTLVSSGYLVRTSEGRYDVGPRSAMLSRQVQQRSGPRPELSMILDTLSRRTGEACYLSGLQHRNLVLQRCVNGPCAVIVNEHADGEPRTLHARASGKALLASLPSPESASLLERLRLEPVTDRTITHIGDLTRELDAVRRSGFAMDREEFRPGLACISSPFFGQDGEVVGVFTVTASVSRMRERYAHITISVREAAAGASAVLRSRAA